MLASGLLPAGVNCSASKSHAFLGVWIGQEYCESAVLQEIRTITQGSGGLASSRKFQVACMELPALPLDRPVNVTVRLQNKYGSVIGVPAGTLQLDQVESHSASIPALSQNFAPPGHVVNDSAFAYNAMEDLMHLEDAVDDTISISRVGITE